MVKKLKPKNKKALFLLWTFGFLALAGLSVYILSPSINLILNIFPLLPSTPNGAFTSKSSSTSNGAFTPARHITSESPSTPDSNSPFYGENIDMSQILPTSQHYVVNSKGQDLIDIAADLGINLIRITNAQRSFNNNADSVYTGEQWQQVLGKMQRKGIKALILIETASDNPDYYTPAIQPVYLNLVQEYIDSGVFSNPDVYGVDIKNESLLTDANISMLQSAHMMLKKTYPDLKQTIGWWATIKQAEDPYNRANYNWSDFSASQKIDSMIDFYSIHMYGLGTNILGVGLNPDLKTKAFLLQAEMGLQTKKPILIEEFGEANGDAVSDQNTIGSPQLQANVYQGVYQALSEIHSKQIIGSVAFDFYSRNQYPDAWAIVKNNGNYLFPAAYILQEYATGENKPSVQSATVVTSQSYLLTNASNNAQENLHVSDRIGLKLQLDTSKTYSLSLSTNGIVQPLEVFHYDPVLTSYYAVYQAASKGSVQLTITPDPGSQQITDGLMDTTPVYTVTIHVQS